MRVPSSDQVSVAIHDFGGTGRPLLIAHATGFHGYCYLPIADALDDRFRAFAADLRGHGATPRPAAGEVEWAGYGDDALAAARAVAPDGGIVAFGHSMGGTALLMAADREPDLFDLIVAFEPIVMPPDAGRHVDGPSALVEGARRRRASFETFEAAVEHYASKPPMDAFDRDVLRLYVAHGFRPAPEGIRLKCDPEHEARTFEGGGRHRTWDRLPEISTRVVVATSDEDDGPALAAGQIAARLPDAELVTMRGTTHFAPFTDPAVMARVIADAA